MAVSLLPTRPCVSPVKGSLRHRILTLAFLNHVLQDVTAADIKRVIAKWIAPIFDSSTSIGAVASGLAKMEDLAKHFEESGYEVERRTFGADDDDSGDETGSESGSGSESDA